MSWISALIPDRRQRNVSLACLLVFALTVLVAALTSRAEDWQPLSLVLVLLAFSIASEMMAFRHEAGPPRSPWVFGSTAPMALAVTLLGPAPALAIGVAGLAADAIYRRATLPNLASNLGSYGLHLVTAGLISRWVTGTLGLAPDEAGFAFLVLGMFVYISATSMLMNAFTGELLYGEPIRDQFRREGPTIIGAEGPTSFLAAGAGYAYGVVGLEALGLLAVAQLTYQYLAYNLVLSQERAEALQRRADELASLHDTLKAQASRLAEVSASRGRLLGQVMQAEEVERRRLAEALHDEALQNLLTAKRGLAEPANGGIDHARTGIQRTIDQLRGAIFNLHPDVLEQAGLAAALRAVASQQAEQGGFRAHVDVDPEAAGHHDALLFVLCREQLTNAAKHAGATDVALVVSRSEDSIVMDVKDDGCGMDPDRRHAALENGHIGLATSASRVEALGGQLEIESEPGAGTLIRTRLPLTSGSSKVTP